MKATINPRTGFWWSKRAIERLVTLTLDGNPLADIAHQLGCHTRTARDMQIEVGLVKPMVRHPWTAHELATLKRHYPDTPTVELAGRIGRTVGQVYQAADRYGLSKAASYLTSPAACRLRRGDNIGAAFRFKKGQTPANKGVRRPGWAPGRMRETQFKRGERRGAAARNWVPVGTIKADTEGYLRIKVRESNSQDKCFGFGNAGIWPLMQRHIWEQQHGSIPAGHTVVFKDGNRAHVVIGNLELISRAELMRRNTIHRLPEELRNTIMLLGAVKRKVREKSGKE